jgi:hypothetical protein
MSIDLPLDEMSTAEKLELLEAVRASLCREPADFNSPEWRQQTLDDRKRRLESGQATVSDWNEAKKRLEDMGR